MSKTTIGIIVGILVIAAAISTSGNKSTDKDNTASSVSIIKSREISSAPIKDTIKDTSQISSEKQTEIQTIVATQANTNDTLEYNGKIYKIIEVDGGNLSGERLPNVAVDVGYGDRVYWAFTNEYGQLVNVIADKVILQDAKNEHLTSDGRYYKDEAKVPGTEREDLDEGHVIADSLGGVSNAYNISPQNSTLNRYGNQAYMEKVIRDAGGCENFIATITYPNTKTQIPSKYRYEYVLKGNKVVDEFDNVDPDAVNNASKQANENNTNSVPASTQNTVNTINEAEALKKIDTNGNGKVTIAEAKAAGYSMPIYSDNWLYKYMTDSDGDGMVGEK